MSQGRTSEIRGQTLTLVTALALLLSAATLAAPMPPRWHPPRWWLREAVCIHRHEGAWNDETGNGYSGGLQFLPSTWASVGGVGRPSQATPREQLYRAWLVWLRDGHSWREWGSARACGLT